MALWKAETILRKCKEPYDGAAHLLEIEDVDLPSVLLSQKTEGLEFMSDVVPTGRDVSLWSRSSCRATAMLPRDEDEEDDGLDGDLSRSWARMDASKRKGGLSSEEEEEEEDAEMSELAPTRKYCTQACLLGLKRGWDLDINCPNVPSHRTGVSGTRHPIDADEFTRLVGERLC